MEDPMLGSDENVGVETALEAIEVKTTRRMVTSTSLAATMIIRMEIRRSYSEGHNIYSLLLHRSHFGLHKARLTLQRVGLTAEVSNCRFLYI